MRVEAGWLPWRGGRAASGEPVRESADGRLEVGSDRGGWGRGVGGWKLGRVLGWLVIGAWAWSGEVRGAVEEEYWARLMFGGKAVGHYHSKTEAFDLAGEQVFQTTLTMALVFARSGTTLEISFEGRTLEGADGMVRDYAKIMRLGAQRLESRGTVRDGTVRVVAESGESTMPYPEGALGPRAFDRAVRRPGLEAGVKGEAVLFDVENPGEGQAVSWEVLGIESKEVLGSVTEAIVVELKYAKLPGMPIKATLL
ncbi:MAG: hypothetical protein SNJ84_09210, partial [Verrucomicrobiia bacterium]